MDLDIINRFNLPNYVKDKSFAEASKLIENKFKDRNDKPSLDTKQELLQRLANAQEFIKSQNNIDNYETNDAFFGGNINEQSIEEGASLNDYLGAAKTGLNFANQIFGDTGIDTSGKQKYETPDVASQTIGNTLSGVQEGVKVGGPLGGVVGGSIGLVSGLIGGKKKKDDINEANRNAVLSENAKIRQSDFAYGGKMKKNSYQTGGDLDEIFKIQNPEFLSDPEIPVLESSDVVEAKTPDQTKLGKRVSKVGDFLKQNYGDILRYSPVVSNLLQLKNLDKPTYESYNKLDSRYTPDYVDEESLARKVEQAGSTTRRALTEASGGDLGALRSGLIASDLNQIKALSDAYLQAENINRGENRARQEFDTNVDRTNLSQSNLEKEINARNLGAYDTNKSLLLSQLGTDFGNIGREEKYKQMVKDMGICYDSRGRYICGTDERIPDDMQLETNENKYGGKMDNNSIFTDYLQTVLNNKKNG